MNSIKLMAILFFALFSPTIFAQESFLRFDSIQVIETEHVLTKSGSIGGVLDTITIQVLPDQYIKIRNVSLSVRGTSSSYSGVSSDYMQIIDYDRNLYDLRLDLGKTNLINTTDFGRQFVGVNSYLRNTNNFGVTKDIGIFLGQGSHDLIIKYAGYFGSSQPDREVISRLEFIHFSKE